LRQGDLVDFGIPPARDERGHPADRMSATAMARLDEQICVCAHERHAHRHEWAIREDELGPVAELLDDREHVVPAARIEPGGMLSQLVEDLVHLEGGEDRLDEDCRPDRCARNGESLLRMDEDVVPGTSLEGRL